MMTAGLNCIEETLHWKNENALNLQPRSPTCLNDLAILTSEDGDARKLQQKSTNKACMCEQIQGR